MLLNDISFEAAIKTIQVESLQVHLSGNLKAGECYGFPLYLDGEVAHDGDCGSVRCTRPDDFGKPLEYSLEVGQNYENITVVANYSIAQIYFAAYQKALKKYWEDKIKNIQKAKADLKAAGVTLDDLNLDLKGM